MARHPLLIGVVGGLLGAGLAAAGIAAMPAPSETPSQAESMAWPQPPLRLRMDVDEARLEVARVTLARGDRTVEVQGMVHLGSEDFFAAIEADHGAGTVFYEGLVAEPDAVLPEPERVWRTRDRLWRLARARARGLSTDDLVGVDAWGRGFVEADGVLLSYGADGVPGGDGVDADLSSGGLGEEPGMDELAAALDLGFQLTHLDTDRPGWRNVDLGEAEIRRLLLEAGADDAAVGELLDDELSSGLAVLYEGLRDADPVTRARTRIVVMDTLVQGDKLAHAGPLGPFQDLIVGARDAHVVREVLATEEDLVLLYGALHLQDLVGRLKREGFVETERSWQVVMSVDLAEHGLGLVHVEQIRRTNARAIARALAAPGRVR